MDIEHPDYITASHPPPITPEIRLAPGTALLDLFNSTSQSPEKRCKKNAPFICIPPQNGGTGKLYQTCCNDWQCPRCGQMRARYEYGRMVEGARTLTAAGLDFYMLTLTCPGAGITALEAEATYLKNTNRLMTNIRYRAKTDHLPWHYASVTERQGRGHPHSHFLTTFCPKDAYPIFDNYSSYCADVKTLNASIPADMRFSPGDKDDLDFRQLFSPWLSRAAVKAGLGVQVRLAAAELVEGASRYIAKYLFKTSAFETWPRGWKRVRYSQNWPKLPTVKATSAFPVLSSSDWARVAGLDGTIECFSQTVYERSLLWNCMNVKCKVANSIDNIVPLTRYVPDKRY